MYKTKGGKIALITYHIGIETGGNRLLVNCILVGLGGGLGAVLRASVSNIIKRVWKADFPLATFLINVVGSFLLGLLLQYQSDQHIRLLIGTGILGGFTTFSTFHFETIHLFLGKKKLTAVLYGLLSLIFACLLRAA
jgi:CrcB protein